MTTKHHTREGYEQLLRSVLSQSEFKANGAIGHMSDIRLLQEINDQLALNGCIQYNYDEIENILEILSHRHS